MFTCSFFDYYFQKRLFPFLSNFLLDLSPKNKNELSYNCKLNDCIPGSFNNKGFL